MAVFMVKYSVCAKCVFGVCIYRMDIDILCAYNGMNSEYEEYCMIIVKELMHYLLLNLISDY